MKFKRINEKYKSIYGYYPHFYIEYSEFTLNSILALFINKKKYNFYFKYFYSQRYEYNYFISDK